MDMVQCRALLQSLQSYGVAAGGADDALEVWHTIMQVVKNACDTEEDWAVAASLLFDANIGILRFCKSSIAAQGAPHVDAHLAHCASGDTRCANTTIAQASLR
jgi:hypothetical protein